MNHFTKIRHVELNLLVQYFFVNSIDVIFDDDVVMNFQIVRAQIQHSLHEIVTVAHHESIHHALHFLQ